jgi:hypothetical protein
MSIPSIVRPQINDSLLAYLVQLTEDVREGKVIGAVITCELTGHEISSYADFRDGVQVMGHLARHMALVNKALDQ